MGNGGKKIRLYLMERFLNGETNRSKFFKNMTPLTAEKNLKGGKDYSNFK
jgi:hypothetical protein